MEVTTTKVMPTIQVAKQETTEKCEPQSAKLEPVPDGNKKIIIGLTALGAIALAGIGLYKHNKKATQQAGEALNTAIGNNAGKIAKTADEAIDIASKELSQGGNYQKVKNHATRNFDKTGKKAIRQQLAEQRNKQVSEAIEASHKNSGEVFSAIDNAKGAKKANQGMKNATTAKEVQERVKTAQVNSSAAKESAEQAKSFMEANPTHKNIKRAKVAENQANRAEIEAKKVINNGEQRTEKLAQQAKEKAKNQATYQSSPNYEAGMDKQIEHKAVTDKNARKRMLSDLRKKPEYKRTLESYKRKRYTEKQLIANVLDKPNCSEIEKQAALDYLQTITK